MTRDEFKKIIEQDGRSVSAKDIGNNNYCLPVRHDRESSDGEGSVADYSFQPMGPSQIYEDGRICWLLENHNTYIAAPEDVLTVIPYRQPRTRWGVVWEGRLCRPEFSSRVEAMQELYSLRERNESLDGYVQKFQKVYRGGEKLENLIREEISQMCKRLGPLFLAASPSYMVESAVSEDDVVTGEGIQQSTISAIARQLDINAWEPVKP